MDWIQQWQSKLNKQNGVAPLVRPGGSRHTGLAALPHRNIQKRHFSMLLVYLVVFFSIRPTIFPLTWSQDATGGMGIISFIMLYCIGAWIRKYYKRNENQQCREKMGA